VSKPKLWHYLFINRFMLEKVRLVIEKLDEETLEMMFLLGYYPILSWEVEDEGTKED